MGRKQPRKMDEKRASTVDALCIIGRAFCVRDVTLCLSQDNYNALHIAAMYSREDVVKLLLSKRGVDPYATGGVCSFLTFQTAPCKFVTLFFSSR